ncbi:YciI family protein [Ornithinicoccus halotolerans]|uniref:YciI family protein n=1 Tax=Ornithinicoccus halotolerans TaxID=1748220 RepID=UPI001297D402|nr:YciI family protein [Ornithinicoccus halotolerans]
MKYLLLMYGDESHWDTAPAEERERIMRAHQDFGRAVAERAQLLGGEALAPADTTTTLGPDTGSGRAVTDGPYAETVEQLGGFYLVEAADLDVMTELCGQLPGYYTLEIRPALELG